MGGLGTPLAQGVGGNGPIGQPYIVNILPLPDSEGVRVSEPVRLSVRDKESYVDPVTLNLDVGYAKVFSKGTKRFDEDLPRTRLLSVGVDPPVGDATVEVTTEGVRVTKSSAAAQRSTFFTSVDVGPGFHSAIAMARMRPEAEEAMAATGGPLNLALMPGVHPLPFAINDMGSNGAVFGLENGPRNTAVYAHFLNVGTVGSPVRVIRIAGPDVAGVRTPDLAFVYNWSEFHKYFIVWNEVTQKVEFYADIVGITTRIVSLDVGLFQLFSTTGVGTPQRGSSTDITMVYGQEGVAGDRVTVSRVAVAVDVGFPIIGGARPGSYLTTRKSAEVIEFAGEDPREKVLSPWFNTPSELFPGEDVTAFKELIGSAFRLAKTTAPSTVTVFREEPGFARTAGDGFLLEASFFGTNSLRDESGSGMGFVISDGTTVYQIDLLDDSRTRTVGLLRRGGLTVRGSGHFTPATPVDWSSPVSFRFTVDSRRGLIEMFLLPDINTPIMSIPFNRDQLPQASTYGWSAYLPFIAVGHITNGATLGSMDVYRVLYSHLYQGWEARDADLPEVAGVSYTKVGSGSPAFTDDRLQLTTVPGQQLYYHHTGVLDVFRGSVVEARLQIVSFKPRSSSGVYVVLDDGTHAWMLTFVDTALGKFVAVSLTAGLNDIGELAGTEGLSAKVSFPLDWTQTRTYRIERRPDDGLYIFVDQSSKPSLVVLDKDRLQVAQTRQNVAYPTPPFFFPAPGVVPNGAVAFGHLKKQGAVSRWEYVRHTFSLGFEVTAKKNRTEAQLIDEIAGTQALVVAFATDRDL